MRINKNIILLDIHIKRINQVRKKERKKERKKIIIKNNKQTVPDPMYGYGYAGKQRKKERKKERIIL